jgi:hypothetical protein
MKKILIGFLALTSVSAFANVCTISLDKGANYGDINEMFISFSQVEEEFQRLVEKKGYTLVSPGTASVEAKLSSVIHMTNAHAELRQVDAYTLNSNGTVVLDAYSRGEIFNKSAKRMTFSAVKKLVMKLPSCAL